MGNFVTGWNTGIELANTGGGTADRHVVVGNVAPDGIINNGSNGTVTANVTS